MRHFKAIIAALALAGAAAAQTNQQAMLVTRIFGITSTWPGEGKPGVIDNRSTISRNNDFHNFLVNATGTWSVTMQYSDAANTGPWTTFGSFATLTNGSAVPWIGWAFGYHPFIRFVVTGNASVNYAATRQFYYPVAAPAPPGFTFRGAWNGSTAYNANDLVYYNGSSYLALVPNTGVTPGTNPAIWSLFVQGNTGTISNIATGCGASGGPITTTGTISTAEAVDPQSGSSPFAIPNSDCGKLIARSGSTQVLDTIAQAGSGGSFQNGWWADYQCLVSSGCVITPATSTINGQASISLVNGNGARIVSDGSNYYTQSGSGIAATAGGQLQYYRTKPNAPFPTFEFSTLPILNPADYAFTSSAMGTSISPGSQTVTLAPCPLGVNGTDTNHYVYISGGTGTAEPVLITGGTCTSGASTGTVTFTTANSHSGAWTVSSATTGVQEVFNVLPTGGCAVYGSTAVTLRAPIRWPSNSGQFDFRSWCLGGQGTTSTVVNIDPAFPLSVNGVLDIENSNAPIIRNIQFAFPQDYTNAGTLTHYPALAYVTGSGRGLVQNVLSKGTYNGFNLTSCWNGSSWGCGDDSGWTFDNLNIGVFGSYGINVDLSFDITRVSNTHIWPYGPTTVGGQNLMGASTVTGIIMKNGAGLFFDNSFSIAGVGIDFQIGPDGGVTTYAEISNSGFEANTALKLEGGAVNVSNTQIYFTTPTCFGPSIQQTGGFLEMTNMRWFVTCTAYNPISINWAGGFGHFALSNSWISNAGANQPTFLSVTQNVVGQSNVIVSNNHFQYAPSTTYVNPIIALTNTTTANGVKLTVTGNSLPMLVSGGGTFVQIPTTGGPDNFHRITGNNLADLWNNSFPSVIQNGTYEDRKFTYGKGSYTVPFTTNTSGIGYNTIYLCDASSSAGTVFLQLASISPGATYTLVKTDSSANSCGFFPFGADTINGNTGFYGFNTQYQAITITNDGVSKWYSPIVVSSGGSGTVNTGTLGHLSFYASSTNAVSDMGTDFTFSGHSIVGALNSTLDMSGSGNFIRIPVIAGGFLGLPGIYYESNNKNTHLFSNAGDGIAGVVTGSVVDGNCAKLRNLSGALQIQDSGAACGSGSGTNVPGMVGSDFQLAVTTTTLTNDTVTVHSGTYWDYAATAQCSFKLTAGNSAGIIDIWFSPSGSVVGQWTNTGTNALTVSGSGCSASGSGSPAFPLDYSRWIGSVNITNTGAFNPATVTQYSPWAGIPIVSYGTGLLATTSGRTLSLSVSSAVLMGNISNTTAAGFALNGSNIGYIGTESGSNNAIAGTNSGVALSAGSCVLVKLGHTLQAGANTFNLNGGGAVNIKSHFNVANNIGTAYAATGTVQLCYDGTQWLDISQ